MCHLLLLLPIVALPVFWVLPPAASVPLYASVSAISIAVYVVAMKAMRRPPRTGREHLVGARGRVTSAEQDHVTVRVDGESWSATSESDVAVGDEVSIVSVDGLRLRVRAAGR